MKLFERDYVWIGFLGYEISKKKSIIFCDVSKQAYGDVSHFYF